MSQDYPTNVRKWDVFEVAVEGPSDGNPFLDHSLKGIFTSKNESAVVDGFYDGDGVYRLRFMPSFEGKYTFVLKGSFLKETLSGVFYVDAADENVHGPVRVSDTHHFSYEDGTPFYPIGTTAYVWHLQSEERKAETLDSLVEAGFNKMRFCIFPKHYDYNLKDPAVFPFEGTPMDASVLNSENFMAYFGKNEGNHFDYDRLNPAYFRNLDECITELGKRGIQADLIIMHPYDRWGFSTMTPEQDANYVKYIAARFSAYHNVWWAMANEYDLIPTRSQADWEKLAAVLVKKDNYHHLRSIHNCQKMYDHSRPWITHCSVQRIDLYKGAELTDELAARYGKPVVMDEIAYEGNIQHGWGNITGEEMVRRFWETAMRGGYPGHGETYLNDDGVLWWSHGGTLHGESWKRVRFLKEVLKQTPGHGLCAVNDKFDCVTAVPEMEFLKPVKSQYIYYFSFMRPSFRDFYIDEDTEFVAEVIDTWNILIRKAGIHKGHFRIDLPARQYMAVRLRRPTEEDYENPFDDESALDLPLATVAAPAAEEPAAVEEVETESVSEQEAEGQLNLFEDVEELQDDGLDFDMTGEEVIPVSETKPDLESSMELNMDDFDLTMPEESDTELLDEVGTAGLRTSEMSLTNSDLFKPGLDDIEPEGEEDLFADDDDFLEDEVSGAVVNETTDSEDEPLLLEDPLDDTADLIADEQTLNIAGMSFRNK